MPPPYKRLGSGHAPARHLDHRLVVEDELVLRDRALQLEPLHSWPSQSVPFFGASSPRWRYVRSVATRPRGVRLRYPSCNRYGSYTSSIVSASSLTAAASVSSPTGPPPNLSVIARRRLRSRSSRPASSTSSAARASRATASVTFPSCRTWA